jgi:acyl dehydratase
MSDSQARSDAYASRGLVGLTFDEFNVGDEYWSPGRTVTESDITLFAAISSDWNPHHVDAQFASTTALGQRIAHGGLVVAIAAGLVVRVRVFERTIVALLEWTWKFMRPVVIGSRLQARIRVLEKIETSNPERGIVVFEVAAINEDDDEVAVGTWKVLTLRRAES